MSMVAEQTAEHCRSKMGTIGNKMGRKFEQKRKAKWVKKKANLVKAY